MPRRKSKKTLADDEKDRDPSPSNIGAGTSAPQTGTDGTPFLPPRGLHKQTPETRHDSKFPPSVTNLPPNPALYLHKPMMPPVKFVPGDVDSHFTYQELSFTYYEVTDEREKFSITIRGLNPSQLKRIKSKLPDINDSDCYTKLKELMLTTFSEASHQKVSDLLEGKGYRQLRPDALYDKLLQAFEVTSQELSENAPCEKLIRQMFLYFLPPTIASMVRIHSKPGSIQTLVSIAVKAMISNDQKSATGS